MTTKTTPESSTPKFSSAVPLSSPPSTDAPTDGPKVVKWIQSNCVYGEGDKFGQPVRLDRFQKHFLYHLYELKADGSRRYRRALLEVPKGNGKTPISAWVGLYELCGPGRKSPVIPVAAASYSQADLLFGDMRTAVSESPTLSQVLEAFEGEIQIKGGAGRAYKVAAVAGTNDGQRPSCFLADEIHEWTGRKERVHLVIGNGCAKRDGSLQLNTTTPGFDIDSMAGRMHQYGLKVNAGEVVDDEFLFVWYGADETLYDLDDPDQLEAAIRAANPAAESFLNVADVKSRYYQIPRSEFCRYHLGQWTRSQEYWFPPGAWEACAKPGQSIPDGARVVLGFDGSFNNDSTALVACSLPTDDDYPHLEVVEAWEIPEGARPDWSVPIVDVEEMIRQACRRWDVVEIACDPYRWQRSLAILQSEGLPVIEFPQRMSHMTPATGAFFEATMNRQLSHSGDPRMDRHIANCVLKVDSSGQRLSKDAKGSPRKIDLAIAGVMAFARAFAVGNAPGEQEMHIW